MCHGCGGCTRICEQGAITEVNHPIGKVAAFKSGSVMLTHGVLDIGVAMAPPLIHAVKQRISDDRLVILDAPPGTTCPVIATLKDVDYVVLVTEPTPFGLSDLKLAVEMTRALGRRFGVVINRSGAGDGEVLHYCRSEEIPVLLEIPDDRRVAEAYSQGDLIIEALPEYRKCFEALLLSITEAALGEVEE
jgi:MinD superfamily P-loop ATPase